MVIANAVAALAEISENSKNVVLDLTPQTVRTLLTALNDCTEYVFDIVFWHYIRWGQIFILDSLANYEPKSEKEATQNAERIMPRLAHANSAVVLSAVKVIMKMLRYIKNKEVNQAISRKLAAPLGKEWFSSLLIQQLHS
jgi:vesicle coat complex subunit